MDDKKRLDLPKLRAHTWLQTSTVASRKQLSIAMNQLSDLQANVHLKDTFDAMQECIDKNAAETSEKTHPTMTKRREGRTRSPAATTSRKTLEEDEAARRYALERASTEERAVYEQEFIEGRSKSSGIAGMSDPNEDDDQMDQMNQIDQMQEEEDEIGNNTELHQSDSFIEEILDSDIDEDLQSASSPEPLPHEQPILGHTEETNRIEIESNKTLLEAQENREIQPETYDTQELVEEMVVNEVVEDIPEVENIEHERFVVDESVYEIMEVMEQSVTDEVGVDNADEQEVPRIVVIAEQILVPAFAQQAEKPRLYMGQYIDSLDYWVHRFDYESENGFLGFSADEQKPCYGEEFFLGFEEPKKEKIQFQERITRQQKRRLEVDCIEVELYQELQPAKRPRRTCRNK